VFYSNYKYIGILAKWSIPITVIKKDSSMALYSWFVDTNNSNNNIPPQKSSMWPIAKIQKTNTLLQRHLSQTTPLKIKQLKVINNKS
jgi:hypothetical protein